MRLVLILNTIVKYDYLRSQKKEERPYLSFLNIIMEHISILFIKKNKIILFYIFLIKM